MRKQLICALVAVAALAGIYFLVQNRKIVKNEAYYEAVSHYVYAFSGGAVSSTEPLRVRFVNAAVSKEQIGQPVSVNVFYTSPKIAGQAVWEDDRTILLKPAAPLPFGKKYTAQVSLGRIYPDVPKYAKIFEYNFRVKELAYQVVKEGINTDPSGKHLQEVSGQLHLNEACEAGNIEKMFTAKQGNKALQVNWNHNADGRNHTWTVVGVERSNTASQVKLKWKGQPIGARKNFDETQVVAPLDEFIVLSAAVVQVEEQYILINFSDPISSGQDLSGLVRLSGYTGKLRFVSNGNFLRVYPDQRIVGEQTLEIDPAVRNAAGQSLKEAFKVALAFEDLKPSVRLVGRGAVIPQQDNGAVLFPFEAVGLTAVDVEVFKIFNSNILQFLQVNDLEGNDELDRVGKIILQKKFDLSALNPNASAKTWQRYAFDLQDMIRRDPGTIYQVRIAFRREYTDCEANNSEQPVPVFEKHQEDEFGMKASIMGGERGIYWGDDDRWWWGDDDGESDNPNNFSWDRREDPCAKEYYYEDHFTKRNVFVSDLGLTSKLGRDGSLFLAVTDLHTTQPLSGIDIELFTYQLQSITKVRTEGDGTVMVEGLRELPFVAVATGNNRRGYLRMADGNTLSLSRFDVAGVESQRGLKGYIYGERGVWRPGDSLFLNFVLEDKSGKLPANHPVTMEVTDPRGAIQYRNTATTSVHDVYPFYFATNADAPTGNWICKVMVGSATFTKTLKIETVKPNRLKLNLDFGKKVLASSDFANTAGSKGATGNLKVMWLHGAIAKGLKTKVEMTLASKKTQFQNYKGYSFDDPSRYFYAEPEVLFDTVVDQNGQAQVPLKTGSLEDAPGMLTANFKVRAFEQSGDFSTDNFSLDVSPYDRYVGVFIPTDKWGSKMIDYRGGTITCAMVNQSGAPLANQAVHIALYRVDWRWWWDEDAYSGVGDFNSGEANSALDEAELRTDARGLATWKVKPNEWGRYLVRITDASGGHAAGDFFWCGYPDELNDMASRNAAAMLPFTVDKEKYNVGEEVTLKVPASDKGRILLTLETGSRVARHFWYDAKAGDNLIKFTTEPDMAPTVYAHISLLQPHAQTVNDLPIRMYGVMPVNVEDPTTRLQAGIDMPDVIKPGEFFNVSLRELGGKACTYTLDIVDEGLLDLTRFKTPNPWDEFYAREALGVKTWDIFDYVLGAYSVELDRIFAIGGDGINQKAKSAQVNRFKPVVLHLGPFRLEKGQTARHRLKIENYVGSVRVMAVLSNPPSGPGSGGAYGNAEKTVPVRNPLMILPTLPRVLGPGETLRLPVDVFAMENRVKNATVSVRESSGLVSITGNASTNISFSEPGDKMTYFDLKVGQKTGVAKFSVVAEGAGETAKSDIEIEIRNPNPIMTRVIEGVIEPGQTWTQSGNPTDFTDLKNAFLEISSIPPINLSKQLEYLIQYPHGCIEQTTSSVFPQLYVSAIAPLSDKQKQDVEKNVAAAIKKMSLFQLPSGGFSYWPGGTQPADWAGIYAGHFLLEARAHGYAVPDQLLNKWIEYQTKTSRTWEPVNDNNPDGWRRHDNEMEEAYRLYSLALAGKPDLSGMNRMREMKNKYETTANLLAAAFATSGKEGAAKDLLNDNSLLKYVYNWWGYTYGSDLRDLALRLETYTMLGNTNRAASLAVQVANEVGNSARWYSTQEVATCLRAISKYAQASRSDNKTEFVIKSGSREIPVNSNTPYYLYNFTDEVSGSLAVKNTSRQRLYARAVFNGRPAISNKGSDAKNITLKVRYTDLKGKVIDPAKMAQGTDFIAEVTVTRASEMTFNFNEMALTEIFPSGWEIMNTRMNLVGSAVSSPVNYQDVRDDRTMIYFDLPYSTDKTKQSRTYRVQLNAAYAGKYFLPPVSCEAMYDNRIQASEPGRWVEVI